MVVDTDFTLPATVPDNTVWLYGIASIQTTEPWELCWANPAGDGADSNISRSTTDSQPNSFVISDRVHRLSAQFRVPRCNYQPEVVFSWQPSEGGVQGQMIARMSCQSGSEDSFIAQLTSPWELRRVLGFQRIDDAWQAIDVEINQQESSSLALKLERPMTPTREIRLVATAYLPHAEDNSSLSLGNLMFWQFEDNGRRSQVGRFLPSEDGQEIRLLDSAIRRKLKPDNLTTAQRQLFESDVSGAFFDCTEPLENERVRITEGTRELYAKVSTRYSVTRNRMVEEFTIEVQPRGYLTEQLLLSLPNDDNGEWALEVASKNEAAAAVEVASSEYLSAPDEEGSLIHVKLSKRTANPFNLVGRRTYRFESGEELNLFPPTVANATLQSGEVEIWKDQIHSLNLQADGLNPTPFSASDKVNRHGHFRCASYAYPVESGTLVPKIKVQVSKPLVQSAWATLMHWESTLAKSGKIQHQVTWVIINHGRDDVAVNIPSDAQLGDIWLNGKSTIHNRQEDGKLKVNLPSDKRLVYLSLEYRQTSSPLGWCATVESDAPKINLPVGHRRRLTSVPYPFRYSSSRNSFFIKDSTTSNSISKSGSSSTVLSKIFKDDVGSSTDVSQSLLQESLQTHLLDAESTWGEALLAFDAQPSIGGNKRRKPLLVDAFELALIGITPKASVVVSLDTASGQDPRSRLLKRIVLLETEDELLLTSDVGALTKFNLDSSSESFSQHDTATNHRLSASNTTPAAGLGELIPLSDWMSNNSVSTENWVPASFSHFSQPTPVGDNVRVDLLTNDGPAQVSLVNQVAFQGICWTAFVISLAVSFWLLNASPRALFSGLIGLAVVYCLLPDPIATIAGASALGLAFSGFAILLTLNREGKSVDSVSSILQFLAQRLPARSILLVVTALMTASMPHQLHGADDASVHQVIIPVNKDRSSAGQAYLPKTLYRELKQRATNNASSTKGWLLSNADYLIDVEDTIGPSRPVAPRLTISLRIRVLEESARVQHSLGSQRLSINRKLGNSGWYAVGCNMAG